MKKIIIAAVLLLNSTFSFATNIQRSNSELIRQAVNNLEPLARSGISEYEVKSAKTVKSALYELALQTEYVSEESEFSWVGTSNSAWEGDSTNWGETTLADAKSYLTDLTDEDKEFLDQPENAKLKVEVYKSIKDSNNTFKTLSKAGALFGVAPMGAVQCGFTYAALTVIDPISGKIYIISKEGSGC